MKILGLDLGTNSIGWSLIEVDKNDKGNIIKTGSRIFPAGVEDLGEKKEQSKNATRRDKRQARRQNFRRKLRKERLAKELIKHNMFPDVTALYQKLAENPNPKADFRKQFQTVIQQVKLPNEMRSFFAINPYEMRSRAYKDDKLNLLQIGRIFYHIAQRRGYKESLDDQDKEGEKLYDGKPKEEKTGISETKRKIEEYGTLGNYLYHENPHKKRLRKRYTLRSMYENEFNIIWENLSTHYPDMLTEELRLKIGGSKRQGDERDGILFYQRKLRSQKHLIGNCNFETDKPRAKKSTIPFELERAHEMINSIRVGPNKLNDEDRQVALKVFKSAVRNFKFKKLRKKLSNPDGQYNYDDKDKLHGCPTNANFQNIFGKKEWEDLSLDQQEEIWHIKHFATDPEWLENYAKEKWGLADKKIDRLKSFKLNKDYARKSRKAIMNILPYLQRGFIYDKAMLLGGLRSAFGSKSWDKMNPETHKKIEEKVLDIAEDDSTKDKAIDRIKKYLKDVYLLSDKDVDKLYHHSVKADVKLKDKLPLPKNVRNPVVQQALYELRSVVNKIIETYGMPDAIKVELARDLKVSKSHRQQIRDDQQEREEENIAIKKKLDEYNMPHTGRNILKFKLYDELKDKFGQAVNPYNPEETFSIDHLINGYLEIEHIIPYSISLNDSYANKTLADRETNSNKGNKTPYQYLQGMPERWKLVKDNIFDILPSYKARRFLSKKNPDADQFIERQLNDTRYISKKAKDYLKNICRDVSITQGSVVSMLRYYWGLDGILHGRWQTDVQDGEYVAQINSNGNIEKIEPWSEEIENKTAKKWLKDGKVVQGYVKDGMLYPFKERNDHRHHAVDALAVACSERSYLQQISKMTAQDYSKREIKENNHIEMPWPGFWEDANETINNILVSHKQDIKILTKVKKRLYDYKGRPKRDKDGNLLPPAEGMAARGQLHKETVYGKHMGKDGEDHYHVRKYLKGYGGSSATIDSSAQIKKIVDPAIKKLVKEAIEKADPSIDTSKKSYKVPSDAFFQFDKEQNKLIPKVYLPNKNGKPIPVKKVRIRETVNNAVQLKEGVNQFVNPKNNYTVIIYETKNNNLSERVITFWEAVELKRQGQNIYKLPPDGKHSITALHINDTYVLGLSDTEFRDNIHNYSYLSKYLFRVQTLSSKYYEFRLATEATLDNTFSPYFHRIQSFGKGKTGWKKYNPIKVDINKVGEIKRQQNL